MLQYKQLILFDFLKCAFFINNFDDESFSRTEYLKTTNDKNVESFLGFMTFEYPSLFIPNTERKIDV